MYATMKERNNKARLREREREREPCESAPTTHTKEFYTVFFTHTHTLRHCLGLLEKGKFNIFFILCNLHSLTLQYTIKLSFI